jgi:DNA-binding winged helix-turn-helix (wHTH) protein/tetratricopeptide (TPR) repeat protein
MSLNLGLVFPEFRLRMDNSSGHKIYEFGDFRLDCGDRMLYRGDAEVNLSPKAVETLIALVNRSGQIVSKDDLLSAVWPDTTVEESNLFLYLSLLRKTLGTNSGGKPWIETLRRRGYRFSREVRLAHRDDGEHSDWDADKSDSDRTSIETRSGRIYVLKGWNREQTDNDRDDTDNIPGPVTILNHPGPSNGEASSEAEPGDLDSLQAAPVPAEIAGTDSWYRAWIRSLRTGLRSSILVRVAGIVLILGFGLGSYLVYHRVSDERGPAVETRQINDISEANSLYRTGRFYLDRDSPGDFAKAIDSFQQAIMIDPNNALAYAGLAYALTRPRPLHGALVQERRQRSREAALKALALKNDLAEAHSALAFVLFRFDRDFVGAEREFVRAIDLKPTYADTYRLYGEMLTLLGRHDEALASHRQGLAYDALCVPCHTSYAFSLLLARRYKEALVEYKETLELDENYSRAHSGLGILYELTGNYAESVEQHARTLELENDEEAAKAVRESYTKGGWHGYLRYCIKEADPGYSTARPYAALGEKDKAFSALERSYENNEIPIVLLKVDPRLDGLRSDPRFNDLLRKVGLPE